MEIPPVAGWIDLCLWICAWLGGGLLQPAWLSTTCPKFSFVIVANENGGSIIYCSESAWSATSLFCKMMHPPLVQEAQ